MADFWSRWLRALASVALLLAPMMALATQVRFNIDRQPLPAALKAFADQSKMQLLYQYDTVAGFTGNAVSGELDTHVALESLLRRSGLEIIYSSDSAATIRQPQTPEAGPREPPKPAESMIEPTRPLPQVTIRGEEDIDKQVHLFVSAVTRLAHSPGSASSLARWSQPICALVNGLPAEQSAVILTHLSQAAESAGVKLQPAGCQANLYIVATDEPDQVLHALRKRIPRWFGGATNPTALKHFFKTQRPVRVWYSTQFVGKYGNSLQALDLGKSTNHPTLHNNLAELSALEFDDVRAIVAVVEAVDVTRIAGVDFSRLADYLSMSALAEINFDADLRTAPTILRTFDALGEPVSVADAPAELTAWDRGFLHGLYVTAQSSKMQRSLIEDVMERELAQ
jgi:hypothetical protein